MTPNPNAPGLPLGVLDLLGLGKPSELIESADAFLKMFDFLAREAEFMADQLREYREARRKTIAKLVLATEETVRLRGGTATSVPPRLLIPILEKASLEDVRLSEIHKTWNMRLEKKITTKVRDRAAGTRV